MEVRKIKATKSERQQKIIDLLLHRTSIKTVELSKLLNVSMVTIRRDLRELQASGYVINGYGYVKLIKPEMSSNSFFLKRLAQNSYEKETIAEKALQFVKEGDVLFIDESTTCYLFATKLPEYFNNLHIITNGIHILLALSKASGFTVESSGGSLLYGFDSLVGPKAESMLKSIFAHKFFFSCGAFRQNEGTFELSPFSASVKRIMLENSEKHYLLVDHTKFGSISPFPMATVDEIDEIITDK